MEGSKSRLLAYRRSFLPILCLAVLAIPWPAFADGNPQAGAGLPAAAVAAPPLDVAEVIKPSIPPSRSELHDSAFKKLDVAKKGFVTRDDVRELQGFGIAFDAADTKSAGQLDAEQFKRAWENYSGNGT